MPKTNAPGKKPPMGVAERKRRYAAAVTNYLVKNAQRKQKREAEWNSLVKNARSSPVESVNAQVVVVDKATVVPTKYVSKPATGRTRYVPQSRVVAFGLEKPPVTKPATLTTPPETVVEMPPQVTVKESSREREPSDAKFLRAFRVRLLRLVNSPIAHASPDPFAGIFRSKND